MAGPATLVLEPLSPLAVLLLLAALLLLLVAFLLYRRATARKREVDAFYDALWAAVFEELDLSKELVRVPPPRLRPWEARQAQRLREAFGDTPFDAEAAAQVLDYALKGAQDLLARLEKAGHVRRDEEGRYHLCDA